jgi:hypothetical protein
MGNWGMTGMVHIICNDWGKKTWRFTNHAAPTNQHKKKKKQPAAAAAAKQTDKHKANILLNIINNFISAVFRLLSPWSIIVS